MQSKTCPDGGMVYTEVSKSSAFGLAGSSPALGTKDMATKKTPTSQKIETSQILPDHHIGVWQDFINPSLDDIDTIIEKYGFHELDKEAILEENQYARIDSYDDYLFLVLHFPKYEPSTERYIHNELNVFIAKDYLITFRYYPSTTLKRIYGKYEGRLEKGETITPAFLLYEIIENFLDKTMKMLERFGKDLKTLERDLFNARGTDLIKSIMTRKRNIITLKHMMKPQIAVLKMIEIRMKERFSEEVELYFENLEDKLDKIFSEVQLLQENIDSMEDTLKSVFELETNTTITYLTMFSAFILPLTLVTGFFGMNIESLPFSDSLVAWTIWLLSIGLVGITYIFMKKKII